MISSISFIRFLLSIRSFISGCSFTHCFAPSNSFLIELYSFSNCINVCSFSFKSFKLNSMSFVSSVIFSNFSTFSIIVAVSSVNLLARSSFLILFFCT
ncbi:hypothetical protein ECANGB1_2708 [Enterospora canceri]|uniref:Uncharacterized protein n=1 Tax=Enterospora canceri TaxID=1081671 RepID=A0A1Y1S6V9_9MICR|nr:hypothetical protein ECANGB1_2708 [Enterospora canceri]